MKQSTIHRIIGVICFCSSGVMAHAQATTSLQLDNLSKILGIGSIIIGGLVGYLQIANAKKLAELENKFTAALSVIKSDFTSAMATMEDRIELKFDNRIKDVENKMATRHDINGLKQIMVLQHENVQIQQQHLKEQFDRIENRKQ